jgi:hypothetical protein
MREGLGVELDAVSVWIGDLHAREDLVVLPLGLGHARRTQPLARGSDLAGVVELEAEMVRGRKLRWRSAGRESEQRAVLGGEQQEVLVVVDSPRQAEMLRVERGRALAVGDRQGDVIQRHTMMIAVPYGQGMRRWVAIALAAFVVVGCSSDDDDGRRADPAQSCDLYLSDQGVSARLAGEGAGRTCTSWLAGRAEGGGSWSRAAGADADSGFERVCVVYRGDTAAGLYSTAGPGSLGRAEDVCSRLADRGWEALSPPRTASSEPDSNAEPEASWFAAVRCAEGRCFQRGGEVAQPPEGAECGEGRWTYIGVSSDGQAGVYECLTEPDSDSPVTCDSYNERCSQAGHRVRAPETGGDCGAPDNRWDEAAGDDATRVYTCGRG